MADNVELDAGSGGAVLAADEISGVVHQRVKIQHGADGAATDVSASSPLPIVAYNVAETILGSAARTATTNSSDIPNEGSKGGHFLVDVTSITDSPSIVVHVQGKDPTSSGYYDILVGTAITATGLVVFKVYPGIDTDYGDAANDILPSVYRVRVVHADADSITYSVGANLVQ